MKHMSKALLGGILAGLSVLAGVTEVGGVEALTIHAYLVAAVAALTTFNGVYFVATTVQIPRYKPSQRAEQVPAVGRAKVPDQK